MAPITETPIVSRLGPDQGRWVFGSVQAVSQFMPRTLPVPGSGLRPDFPNGQPHSMYNPIVYLRLFKTNAQPNHASILRIYICIYIYI